MDRDDFTGHSIDDLERAYATDSEWKGPNRITDHPHTHTRIHAITYGNNTDARMKGYGRTRPFTRHTKVMILFDYRDKGHENRQARIHSTTIASGPKRYMGLSEE